MTDFRLADQVFVAAIALDTIQEDPDNPNIGDDDAVAASIDDFGFVGAIYVHAETRNIIAGHTRYRQALAAGAETLPAFLINMPPEDAKAYMERDNHTTRLGRDDPAKLLALLQSLEDRERAGHPAATIDDLVALLAGPEPPAEFPEFGDDIHTEYECPACGHRWSGKPGGFTDAADGQAAVPGADDGGDSGAAD